MLFLTTVAVWARAALVVQVGSLSYLVIRSTLNLPWNHSLHIWSRLVILGHRLLLDLRHHPLHVTLRHTLHLHLVTHILLVNHLLVRNIRLWLLLLLLRHRKTTSTAQSTELWFEFHLFLLFSSLLISKLSLFLLLVGLNALSHISFQFSALSGRKLVKFKFKNLIITLIYTFSNYINDSSLLLRCQLTNVLL